jgi:hypothetical protein
MTKSRTTTSPTVAEIALADDPEPWETLGFTVSQGAVQIGTVRIALVGRDTGRGIAGWSLLEVASTELDGLPTTVSHAPPARTEVTEHANGITAIDHVVAMSPDLDRSVKALRAAGLDLRRIRDQPTPAGAPRQAFFRPDEVLAARSAGADGPTRFWGLALLSDDLEQTAGWLGEHASQIRPALQPGRQIATLRRSAGLAVPVALMSRAVI